MAEVLDHPLERHALSALMGDMDSEQFASFLADVEQHGLTDPLILMYEGKILDGFHRYRSALRFGLLDKLRFVKFEDFTDQSPFDFVVSRNMRRRHWSKGQLAQVAVRAMDFVANGEVGRGKNRSTFNVDLLERNTIETAASRIATSTQLVQRAKRIERHSPLLADEVIRGAVSQGQALDRVRAAEADRVKQDKLIEQELPAPLLDKSVVEDGRPRGVDRKLSEHSAPKKVRDVSSVPVEESEEERAALWWSEWRVSPDLSAVPLGKLTDEQRVELGKLLRRLLHPDRGQSLTDDASVLAAVHTFYLFAQSALDNWNESIARVRRDKTRRG